jgi:hypothetical protein
MAVFDVNGFYTETIEKFTTSDPGHADVFNARMQVLLDNDKYIKEKVDQCPKGNDLEFSVIDGILNVTFDNGEEG